MENQTDSPAPPVTLSDRIRGIEPGTSCLFPAENRDTIYSLACRIAKSKGWKLKTWTEKAGIRVWREPDIIIEKKNLG